MPFLAAVRARFPKASITLLAKPMAADLLAGTRLVDRLIPAALDWADKRTSVFKRATAIWRIARKLRREKFDLAFSARRHLRERLLLALSGARRRIGFSVSDRELGLTHTVQLASAGTTRAEQWLRLLDPSEARHALRSPRLCTSPDERAWAQGYLGERGVKETDIVVGVHPGASLAEKRWPIERFYALANELADTAGVRVLTFVEPGPSPYGAELFHIPRVIAAQTTLRELMALIERCDVLICNDSGPMHIAGALGVPTVAMFGSGIGESFAPLGAGHRLLEPLADASDRTSGIRSPRGISLEKARLAVVDAVQEARRERKLSAQ